MVSYIQKISMVGLATSFFITVSAYFCLPFPETLVSNVITIIFALVLTNSLIIYCDVGCSEKPKAKKKISHLLTIFFISIVMASSYFLLLETPLFAWDFFGEWGFGGYGDAVVTYIEQGDSVRQSEIPREVQRHSQQILKFIAATSTMGADYNYTLAPKIFWGLNFTLLFLVLSAVFHEYAKLSIYTSLLFAYLFSSIPIVNNSILIAGYFDSWMALGLLIMIIWAIRWLATKEPRALFAMILVSIIASTTKSVAPIFVLAIIFSNIAAATPEYLSRKFGVKTDTVATAQELLALLLIMLGLLVISTFDISMSIAGRTVEFRSVEILDLISDERHRWLNNSSFSVLSLLGLLSIYQYAQTAPQINSAQIRRFMVYAPISAFSLITFAQFTDYGSTIGTMNADTGITRLHVTTALLLAPLCASLLASMNATDETTLKRPYST
jgi:hypothetical protein